MIASEDLRTIDVHTDWDLPLVDQLKDVALIYYDWDWFEGEWEQLEALAAEILHTLGDDQTYSQKLRRHYNDAVVERQKYEFAEDSEDDGEEVGRVHQALVEVLSTCGW